MDVLEYWKRIKAKYDAIARQSAGTITAKHENTLGDALNIREGRVRNQLPPKVLKKALEEDLKRFPRPKVYRGRGKKRLKN